MGTPDIAASCLDELAKDEEIELVGAVCQPDRPVGRGMVLTPPPVKKRAEALSLPVYQPERLKDGELLPLANGGTFPAIRMLCKGPPKSGGIPQEFARSKILGTNIPKVRHC